MRLYSRILTSEIISFLSHCQNLRQIFDEVLGLRLPNERT